MKDQKRLMIMVPALAIAAWLALFGDKTPAGKNDEVIAVASPARIAEATPTRPLTVTANNDVAVNGGAAVVSLSASARDNIKIALAVPSPPNLFGATGAAAASVPTNIVNEDDPPPPQAPHFVVIGSIIKDGRFNVFLDKDNQTYIAAPGAVIDGNRVDVVKSDMVQLYNLSTKATQIIPIEGDK